MGIAIRKHGRDAWGHESLEICHTQEEADVAETKWILQLGTLEPYGYNSQLGGSRPKTPEIIQRMKAAYKKKPEEEKARQVERLRRSYKAWLATTTAEQRRQAGRDAWKGYTSEQRSAIVKAGKAKQSAESRREAGLKGRANMSPEARRAVRAKQLAGQTPEQRSEIGRKGAANLTPDKLEHRRACGKEMMAKLRAARTPESEAKRFAATRAGHAARSPEEKAATGAKHKASRTPEVEAKRSMAIRAACAARTPEQKATTEANRWETRRRNSAALADAQLTIALSAVVREICPAFSAESMS